MNHKFSKGKYDTMMKEFMADFPNCFTVPKQPLALNIEELLIKAKPEYSRHEICEFLKIYYDDSEYRNNLVLRARRVSLDGNVTSLVNETDFSFQGERYLCNIYGFTSLYFTWLFKSFDLLLPSFAIAIVISTAAKFFFSKDNFEIRKVKTKLTFKVLTVTTYFFAIPVYGIVKLIGF